MSFDKPESDSVEIFKKKRKIVLVDEFCPIDISGQGDGGQPNIWRK